MTNMRGVYGGTIFLAAFLLFAVEPMAAKQLLPVLGGSSAVWVTCLVFFQGMLLLGYLYAHWMTRSPRIWVYLGVLMAAVGMLVLPVAGGVLLGSRGMDIHFNSGAIYHPVITIFLALGATIGLPFLVLGSTSPLLQVWFARANDGVVPYRLFGLSNVGSLLALALYPTLIEPHLALAMQWGGWAFGFAVYAVVSAWLGWRAMAGPVAPATVETPTSQSASRGRVRALWFLLPMAAAMQLAAVTSHLSQDVAAIPMLWVLPLGVYLVTFILAFDMPGMYRRWLVVRVLVVMLASLGYALSKVDTALPIGMAIAFYLVELFIACWFCHAEVYRLRPEGVAETTFFYLMVAEGGVAGTFLVAIASPLVFAANYDLAISFLVTAGVAAVVTWSDGWGQRALWLAASALLLALGILLRVDSGRQTLVRARNFYGSLRVTETSYDAGSEGDGDAHATGPVRALMNGRIRHGTQMLLPDKRRVATTYYAADSGVGVALRSCCEGRAKRVGVIGLGVGTLAAYANPGDRMRFYEINPLVEPVARRFFSYVSDSQAQVEVVSGDGRASLALEAPQGFDVLVVDAFSGDAIPLHLLTREAMALYRRHLAPGGVIAFHVSNSYLDLAPEILRLADSVGMQARRVESLPIPAEDEYRATWVLVSGDAGFFAMSAVEAVTTPIREQAGVRLWTDDYSSLLPVMRWGR